MSKFVCSVCGEKVNGNPQVNRPVPAENNRAHNKCNDAVVIYDKDYHPEQKSAARARGREKAQDRKALTGRFHQGNHDSNTKQDKRNGKSDTHGNGQKQAGKAGENQSRAAQRNARNAANPN
jgi:hypothetical protein